LQFRGAERTSRAACAARTVHDVQRKQHDPRIQTWDVAGRGRIFAATVVVGQRPRLVAGAAWLEPAWRLRWAGRLAGPARPAGRRGFFRRLWGGCARGAAAGGDLRCCSVGRRHRGSVGATGCAGRWRPARKAQASDRQRAAAHRAVVVQKAAEMGRPRPSRGPSGAPPDRVHCLQSSTQSCNQRVPGARLPC
jgi:hypothetical protein